MRSRTVTPPKPSRTKVFAFRAFRAVRKVTARVARVPKIVRTAGADVAAAWRESGGRYR